jgi:hypothetical protein
MRFSALDPVKDAEQSMADFDLAASVGKHKVVPYSMLQLITSNLFFTLINCNGLWQNENNSWETKAKVWPTHLSPKKNVFVARKTAKIFVAHFFTADITS